MSISIRAIAKDELKAFRRAVMRAFGSDPEDDDERSDERLADLAALDRTYAALDGDAIIATSSTFPLTLAVPGGSVPMGGFTMATVHEAYRRRGILRAMIDAHLRDARAKGEPLSGLWASESSIYGRFGYGAAAEGERIEHCRLAIEDAPDDVVRPLEADRAAEVLPPLYARIAAQRPGTFARSDAWWEHRCFHDPPARRQGASARRHVVALRDDVPVGYAVYRHRPSWTGGVADGTIEIVEVLGEDGQAERSLWRLLSSVDLFPRVRWWNAPVDGPLPWIADNRRQIGRTRHDTLWLRICDVGRALAGRAYHGDGRLVLEVADPVLSDVGGVYELSVEDGRAACSPSSGAPDLHLDISTLSSIYLGATPPSTLARVGRIRGEKDALSLADQLFSWPQAPWCPEIF